MYGCQNVFKLKRSLIYVCVYTHIYYTHTHTHTHMHAQLYLTLKLYGLQPARLLCPRDSAGKNTEVCCNAILQGMFQTQNRTHVFDVSCTGRQFLTTSDTGKTHTYIKREIININLCVCIVTTNQKPIRFHVLSHSTVSYSL